LQMYLAQGQEVRVGDLRQVLLRAHVTYQALRYGRVKPRVGVSASRGEVRRPSPERRRGPTSLLSGDSEIMSTNDSAPRSPRVRWFQRARNPDSRRPHRYGGPPRAGRTARRVRGSSRRGSRSSSVTTRARPAPRLRTRGVSRAPSIAADTRSMRSAGASPGSLNATPYETATATVPPAVVTGGSTSALCVIFRDAKRLALAAHARRKRPSLRSPTWPTMSIVRARWRIRPPSARITLGVPAPSSDSPTSAAVGDFDEHERARSAVASRGCERVTHVMLERKTVQQSGTVVDIGAARDLDRIETRQLVREHDSAVRLPAGSEIGDRRDVASGSLRSPPRSPRPRRSMRPCATTPGARRRSK